MYFSSVLDLCTSNLVSHAFSHRSYCNSQLDGLFARAAFHWPISSKHFSHCGFVPIGHSSWLISHSDQSVVPVNCFLLVFLDHLRHDRLQ